MWNFISSLTGYLPRAFSEASLILAKVESGTTQLQEQWQRCVNKASAALGFATSALYVEEFFSPSSKEKVTSLTEDLQTAFIENLETVEWMDDPTRERLKVKAEAVKEMVGYPDWILNPEKLDEYYEKLSVVDGELLENHINSIGFEIARQLDKYGKPSDRDEWRMWPHEVNAYYMSVFNTIVVPAGILQPPFYSPDFPESFIYGAIGMVLGHELSHGFDNKGRLFDEKGNMADMWTKAAANAFQEKSQCMVQQYSKYMVRGYNINGELTLAENIADNAGLKIAYNAYKASASPQQQLPALALTNDQLFFLGFAQLWCSKSKPEIEIQAIYTDPHSNSKARVVGVLQNSKEFSQVYNCSKSLDNANDRCEVW